MPNTLYMEEQVAPGEPPVRVMSSYHTTNIRHDHDFYELVYVTEGFCLHDAGGQVALLMEGDIFILKPWIKHKYSGNRVTRIYNCVFSLEAVGDCLEELRRMPGLDQLFSPDLTASIPRLHLTLSERKAFLRLISCMYEESVLHPTGWRICLKNLLGYLLVEYARAYQAHVGGDAESGAYSAYMIQALGYVDEHYGDCGLTVQDIAAWVGVSGDYLSRQFRQVIGIPAQEYLRRYRFARSMELLQAGVSVGQVAKQVGFCSLSYFSREFKREMGVTPTQYKMQND